MQADGSVSHCGHSNSYPSNNSSSLDTFHFYSFFCPFLKEQTFLPPLSLSTSWGLHHSIFFPSNFYANSTHLFTATLSPTHVTLLRRFKGFRVRTAYFVSPYHIPVSRSRPSRSQLCLSLMKVLFPFSFLFFFKVPLQQSLLN